MGGSHICILFVEGSGHVRVHCGVFGEVNAVAYLLYLNAVVLSIVLGCELCKFHYSNIFSFLNLLEQAVIKAWPSIQILYFFLCQPMWLVLRVYYDIPTLFHQLLADFIISVIFLRPFFYDSSLCKSKADLVGFGKCVIWAVIFWPWLQLCEFKRLGC